MGILERNPHLPFPFPTLPPSEALLELLNEPVLSSGRDGRLGCGTSKMCRVDLSEVQASMVPDGLKAREKMVAGSMPRRSSTSRAQLLVANTRMRVPL